MEYLVDGWTVIDVKRAYMDYDMSRWMAGYTLNFALLMSFLSWHLAPPASQLAEGIPLSPELGCKEEPETIGLSGEYRYICYLSTEVGTLGRCIVLVLSLAPSFCFPVSLSQDSSTTNMPFQEQHQTFIPSLASSCPGRNSSRPIKASYPPLPFATF